MAEFPPIADYGFLSDCEYNCLVAPDGSVEWFCLPRPDSPSLFGALLDRGAGMFRFGPSATQIPQARRYLPGTMVLETTWHTQTGWLVVTDLLVTGPTNGDERRSDYRRAPGDTAATGTLLRIATCIDGRVEVVANCFPMFDYGRVPGEWGYDTAGYHSLSLREAAGTPPMRLTGTLPLSVVGPRAYGRTTLAMGESAFVALSWRGTGPVDQETADAHLDTTVRGWRDWLDTGRFPDHPWRIYIERSALTLKGLTYAPTGAVMAAATTSLPETPGGARNWDYRFTWVRDSGFLLRAMHSLGYEWEALDYFAFLVETIAGPRPDEPPNLQVLYGIGGERDVDEHILDHLSGYRGSRPVRIGNGAYDQKQNDVWGMLLDAVASHLPHRAAQLSSGAWAGLTSFINEAVARWREPDQGIWEIRGDPEHFTASKVLCWVAVDRGIELAKARDDVADLERWQAAAQEMRDDICEGGVTADGRFRQHYNTDELDAALLLIPILGFLPPDDSRVRATVLAIADDLTQDGLVLRYRVDTTDTGLSGEEGTFTICSFWLVTALAMIGEVERARALCKKLLGLAGPLHLYAEEIEASTSEHLGNFPQAFTHLALIEAVSHVIEAEEATTAQI